MSYERARCCNVFEEAISLFKGRRLTRLPRGPERLGPRKRKGRGWRRLSVFVAHPTRPRFHRRRVSDFLHEVHRFRWFRMPFSNVGGATIITPPSARSPTNRFGFWFAAGRIAPRTTKPSTSTRFVGADRRLSQLLFDCGTQMSIQTGSSRNNLFRPDGILRITKIDFFAEHEV